MSTGEAGGPPESGKIQITGSQMMFLLLAVSIGGIPALGPRGGLESAPWLAPVCAFLAGLPLFLLYRGIIMLYPQKSLIKINEAAFGRVLGPAVSALYLAGFFFVASYYFFSLIQFKTSLAMPDTPAWFFCLVVSLLCVYGCRLGFEPIARLNILVLSVLLLTTLVTFVFLLPQMQAERLLPLFAFEPALLLENGFLSFVLQFAFLSIFFLFFGEVKKKAALPKAFFWAFTLSFLFIFFRMLLNVLVLGDTLWIFPHPGLQVFRLAELSGSFTRLELLDQLALIAGLLILLMVSFLGLSKGLGEIFSSKRHFSFIWPLMILNFACFVFFSSMDVAAARALFRGALGYGGAGLIFLTVITFLRGLMLRVRSR
ncbi:MAG: spore germination protein [Clostridiales bacterium]|nr:spore germination protein [Clostridiales bacterium]